MEVRGDTLQDEHRDPPRGETSRKLRLLLAWRRGPSSWPSTRSCFFACQDMLNEQSSLRSETPGPHKVGPEWGSRTRFPRSTCPSPPCAGLPFSRFAHVLVVPHPLLLFASPFTSASQTSNMDADLYGGEWRAGFRPCEGLAASLGQPLPALRRGLPTLDSLEFATRLTLSRSRPRGTRCDCARGGARGASRGHSRRSCSGRTGIAAASTTAAAACATVVPTTERSPRIIAARSGKLPGPAAPSTAAAAAAPASERRRATSE